MVDEGLESKAGLSQSLEENERHCTRDFVIKNTMDGHKKCVPPLSSVLMCTFGQIRVHGTNMVVIVVLVTNA